MAPPIWSNPEPSTLLVPRRSVCFTKTAVTKFDGTVCWQQHQQVFNDIAKSNRWDEETAALQLFAHLEGNALNVALLIPEDKRATLTGLSQALSDYYICRGDWQYTGGNSRTWSDKTGRTRLCLPQSWRFWRLGVLGTQARVPELGWSVIDLYPDTGTVS